MTTKVALLRDLAKLLKKYKLADLSDAVSSLGRRKRHKGRPKSKSSTTSKRTKKSGVIKSARSPKVGSVVGAKRPASTPTKTRKRNHTKGAARGRRVKVRDTATDTLRKRKVPEKQRDTAKHLIADPIESVNRHLTRTPRPHLESRGEDYAKWFRIISRGPGGIRKGDLAAESTSREVDNPKVWEEAIRHLRMRDLLLSGPFKLHGSSPSTSGVITFLPDGVIGMGQTYLAARWRLSEGMLELLDVTGAVQSRFILSNDGRLLTQVVDPTALSTRTSQLVRIAAKS